MSDHAAKIRAGLWDALVALVARCDALEKALREINKLDGRYNDLNTARYLARAALAADQERA
jgi:hypothetical protein